MGSCCSCCAKNEPHQEPEKPAKTSDARFNKSGFSDKDPLELIKGYQNDPIVSLEEALECFIDSISGLSDQIKEAKTNCYDSSEHNLTKDESAAIYLYSIRDAPSIYKDLQKTWESWNETKMKRWFKYLNLLKHALDKLPAVETEIWQGIPLNDDLKKMLENNSLQLYTCMGSCLQSKDDVNALKISDLQKTCYGGHQSHDGKNVSTSTEDKKTYCYGGYISVDGKDVSAFTKDKNKEIMIFPGVKINQSKQLEDDDNGSICVHFSRTKEQSKTRQESIITSSTEPEETTSPSIVSTSVAEISLESQPIIPTSPVSPETKEETLAKHFVCPMHSCQNRCNGDHDPNHCRGFTYVFHTCAHHCGPGFRCFYCKKHTTKLYQCNVCNWRVCQDCCFK